MRRAKGRRRCMALCEIEVRRFPSFQWQLEPSSDYPLYGEILVKLFPAQGGAIQSEAHLGLTCRSYQATCRSYHLIHGSYMATCHSYHLTRRSYVATCRAYRLNRGLLRGYLPLLPPHPRLLRGHLPLLPPHPRLLPGCLPFRAFILANEARGQEEKRLRPGSMPGRF